MIKFIGDISTMDANVLAHYARTATSVLEFGLGGSTQIIAQNIPAICSFISVETRPEWVETTITNLSKLRCRERVQILLYKDVIKDGNVVNSIVSNNTYDFIFVDGQPELRETFFNETFDFLRVGGSMIVHDTKRKGDLRWLFRSCILRWTEISNIALNVDHSSMSVVTKKFHDQNVDWNISEKRDRWESAYETPPADWPQQLVEKYKKQAVKEDWE